MKAEWKIALVSAAGYQGAPVWPTAIVGAKLTMVGEIDKKQVPRVWGKCP